tara:strand:- start:6984 stop:7712 length:729 start_codon:yes stop_codon:yes gene_type:complete
MSKYLLSKLFPNFVKKTQTQHLAKGPFGEGLDAAELDKARVYLKPGEQAPEGAQVQTGPKGGQYYDDMGGGAVPTDEAQPYPAEAYDQAMDAEVDALSGIPQETLSPPDVSEATFDGQGNIQLPGSDPYPISELIGSDTEAVNALGERYQQEGGANPAELLSGYDGPLTQDGIHEYLSDIVQYDDAFVSDNDYHNAIDFASWVGEQSGLSETQKMVKMMQKHNIDNKRRDPIVLSNKGGTHR